MFSFLLVPFVAVQIMFASCPGLPTYVDDLGERRGYSCYDPPSRTIYLARYDRTHMAGFVMAHERGHAYDFQALTDSDRAELRPYLHGPDAWPIEAFANAYARCALRTSGRNRPVCQWLLRRSVSRAAAKAPGHRWRPS